MPFLLDTNVVSAARRLKKQAADFQNFMETFPMNDAFISAVTIMEVQFGIQQESKKDPEFAANLARWLQSHLLVDFSDRILPFDKAIALRTGTLPTPDKRPSPDAMIAATALHHGLTVVTRNISDFEPLGVPCLNPWTFQG
ncbi:type II toxin-antitoxin system VapC family toxin [Neorhizobium galegae]|uniref:PilT protein, N-terminal n=1 Tax=Neorhizobium galegae bv. officinalis TaxID=323656 RepID=A0A0T7GGI9_NEOGA|nr:type II toxin-antitoxin system VapC family toxin [Neorhizobium galegae]CDZ46374.1 PilT protein, N-terminal [Neorhizobium galegae bv. officinalis]